MPLTVFTSSKFRFYAFVSMLLLVYVHAYNLKNSYLQPFTIVDEPLRLTTFLEYWLANGLFRFRIPLLFIISGYLFSLNDHRPYGDRMKKRLRTLGIPYLFWSAVGLLITFVWQEIPSLAGAVHEAQLGDNRPYSEIGITGILIRWIVSPVAFQLWFIRSLLVYNAAYPLISRAVTRSPKIWFSIIGFLWLVTFAMPLIEGEGLFFFSLGIFLQKANFNIETPPLWLNTKVWGLVFILSSLLKTFLAFQMGWSPTSFITLSLLHKLCVFSGLVTIWFGCDRVVAWCMSRNWFVWLSAFAFFIYALHVPLVNYATRLSFHYLNDFSHYRLLIFFLLPMVIIALCIALGAVTRKLFPVFYSTITGGRGI